MTTKASHPFPIMDIGNVEPTNATKNKEDSEFTEMRKATGHVPWCQVYFLVLRRSNITTP